MQTHMMQLPGMTRDKRNTLRTHSQPSVSVSQEQSAMASGSEPDH